MGKAPLRRQCVALLLGIALGCVAAAAARAQANEERMITDNAPGHAGGRLAVALRSEPKTLNPALAEDEPSREVIRCLSADLIHINRLSLKTEPALAKSWTFPATASSTRWSCGAECVSPTASLSMRTT